MNFFGHAVLAEDVTSDAHFVLGSMLPDFQSMARAKVAEITHERVAGGVAFHHRTDDVFHRAPIFTEWMGEAQRALDAAGVSWGAARAVSHVGTELLLDGWLLRQYGVERFQAAIAVADQSAGIRWGDDGDAFARLLGRIREGGHAGMRRMYQSPDRVAEVLGRILQPRKRLRYQDGDEARVAGVLEAHQRSVERRGPELMEHLRDALTEPPRPPTPATAATSTPPDAAPTPSPSTPARAEGSGDDHG